MKQQYLITVTLDTQLAEEYNKLAANYENLSPSEYQAFDMLSDTVLYGTEMLQLKPMQDTSIISWLPVNGTVPPEAGQRYLVHIADSHVIMERTWRQYMNHTWYTHYAELPTLALAGFEPVQSIATNSANDPILCDACNKPFTKSEYDGRESPHEPSCPNFAPDEDEEGNQTHVDCICDRNFHSACYDEDLREADDFAWAVAHTLRPDRFKVQA